MNISISEDIWKEINQKSKPFKAFGILYDKKEMDLKLQYCTINDKIKVLYSNMVKIDKKIDIRDLDLETTMGDNYSYRIKDSDNLWIHGIFFKEINKIDDILPEELFKL